MLLKWVTLSADNLQMIAVTIHFYVAMCLSGISCLQTCTTVSFGTGETRDYSQQRTDFLAV